MQTKQEILDHPWIKAAIELASERVGHPCYLQVDKKRIGLAYESNGVTYLLTADEEESKLILDAYGDFIQKTLDEEFAKAGFGRRKRRKKKQPPHGPNG